MSFLLAITLNVSVWVFQGDNTWTSSEWRQMFRTVQSFYKERLNVRLRVTTWRVKRSSPCKRYGSVYKQSEYGTCLVKRVRKTAPKGRSFGLLLTPPIRDDAGEYYTGGIASGVCHLTGAAVVYGKRVSTHSFKDGGNAGWELSRLGILHEVGHLLGGSHTDYGRARKFTDVMNSDALFLLWSEWPNFRDELPLSWRAKVDIRKCLTLKENL